MLLLFSFCGNCLSLAKPESLLLHSQDSVTGPLSREMNPVHTLTSSPYFFKVRFSNILPRTARSSQRIMFFRFTNLIVYIQGGSNMTGTNSDLFTHK
jgi:hypothetical protein